MGYSSTRRFRTATDSDINALKLPVVMCAE
jgi:hypothetical protein